MLYNPALERPRAGVVTEEREERRWLRCCGCTGSSRRAQARDWAWELRELKSLEVFSELY